MSIITGYQQIQRYIKTSDPEYADGGVSRPALFNSLYKGWRYNLRLGREVYLSSWDHPKVLGKGEYIVIPPGEFGLLLTREVVYLDDDVMAFTSIRFDYKQKGLLNASGFHVDPYYHGKLIFSVFNAGPEDIVLRESEPVFLIFFETLDYVSTKCRERICENSAGKQDCDEFGVRYRHIPSAMAEQLHGKSVTLSKNAEKLDRVEKVQGILLTLVVALIGAVIALAVALPPGSKG